LRGRNFSPRDTPNTPTVAIINDTAAQYFFGDEDPIGKKVKVGLVGFRETTEAEIIAISSDSKYTSVREDTPRILYYSSDQEPVTVGERTVYVRTDENPNQFIPVLRTETQYLDKDLPMFNVKTFAEQKAESFIQERLTAAISGSFGVFALLLAAMGLYGVMAYAVLRRTREIGIRMALGAGRASVIWMLLRSALAMAFAGMAISIPLSTWLSALVAANMVGVSRGDPGILATACVILTGVAILAASIPAWKASRIEPMRTLRCE